MLKPLRGGVGTIFFFHSICPRKELPEIPAYRAMCNSREMLEEILRHLHRQGTDLINLDQVEERLRTGSRQRFASFTFDDGYRNNLTEVLPLMEKYQAPFTLFITPGFQSGEAVIWWHYLADLLMAREEVRFTWRNRTWLIPCRSPRQKDEAYNELGTLLRMSDQHSVQEMAKSIMDQNEIKWWNAPGKVIASWDELQSAAAHPLISIGAHSMTHRNLRLLDDATVSDELTDSREAIEQRLGVEVRHFAYPFGGSNAVGTRVLRIGAKSGFQTLATTDPRNLRAGDDVYSLPRICPSGNQESMTLVKAMLNGWVPR